MHLTPDSIVYWQNGIVVVNATLVNTWLVMVVLTAGSWLATRHLTPTGAASRWQTALETIVTLIEGQIGEIAGRHARRYLSFVGTLFLLIVCANLLSIVPGYRSPTGSLSTTAALAACVFVAVPLFGIIQLGLRHYLRQYVQPSVLMLPFNLIGELSRTLALAVRLFGNVMSGEMIVAILLAIVPLFFPVIMQMMGLLVGVIQAYIFAVLATVYIASA
ncbi:MAG: F0F1 ATP synthase subunit A, partial [Caldilineaceae bacterium]|nr:F0F1 ATP synthase subunit A [Caldilineaceae bacterium]